MRRVRIILALLVGTLGVVTAGEREHRREHKQIAILDDCDPRDPNWASVGGCTLEEGEFTLAEFNAFLVSPLSSAVIGHSAWRFNPAYLKIKPDETLRVMNEGGWLHTFTEVATFGGGRVPPLSIGLTPPPGGSNLPAPIASLPHPAWRGGGRAAGNHLFKR